MKSVANASVPPRAPLTSFSSLARQSSIYTLTLEELQNAVTEPGKSFGSMNMEEFLKNIWTAEESQAMLAAMSGGNEGAMNSPLRRDSGQCPSMNLQRQNSMQRQNSLSIPRNLSGKTVDEVWKEIHQPIDRMTTSSIQQPNLTMGETTLEDFLTKAGIVKDDVEAEPSSNSNNSVVTGLTSSTQSDAVQTPQATLPQLDWLNFKLSNPAPHQQLLHYQHDPLIPQPQVDPAGRVFAGRLMAPAAVGLPSATTSNVLDSPFDGTIALVQNSPSLSQALAVHDRKLPFDVYEEKSIEQRQKRMIKNRESAARSRARKQAYTVELESEVRQLKEERDTLLRHQVEATKRRRKELMELLVPVTVQPKTQRRPLHRSQSTIW